MSNIRNRLESGLERLAHRIYRNKYKTILIMLILIVPVVAQLPKLTLDLSTEGFLHDSDPYLLAYNRFRDQFGRDEVVIVAVQPPSVFAPNFLSKVKRLHEDLEAQVPYIEDITSIVNARNTRGNASDLIVEDLMETFPETREDVMDLEKRVLSNPMYKNLMISEDGRFTAIVIKTQNYSSAYEDAEVMEGFEEGDDSPASGTDKATAPEVVYLTNKENSEVVSAVQQVLKGYAGPDFKVYLAGSPVVTHSLKTSMMKDMRKFVILAVLTIALFLFVMFRRISGVILPLVIVVLSLLTTLGSMAATGTPIKLPTQILPSFLLAVCVGASVHILAIFFHHLQQHGDKEDAVAYALGHSGLPCVMTHITTCAGLLSFSTADLAPIADLGVFAGAGVMIALVYTIVLLPAFLAVIPVEQKKIKQQVDSSGRMDRMLSWIAGFSTSHPRSILAVAAVMVVLALVSMPGIKFGHDPLRWFPADNAARISTEKIDFEMRGTVNMEVIVDTGRENGLYEVDVLNRLEQAAVYIESLDYGEVFVGKAWSLTTILKEINQALNENRSDYYVVPQHRDLIAQEFLLFENSGSDDLEDVVDSQFSKARFTIKVPFVDALKYSVFMEQVSVYFQEKFPEASITITGMVPLLFRTVSNVVVSMAKSYVIAIVIITILMIFLIGRVRIGLFSMVPNILPIILMLGIMGIFRIPMDAFTMMVGSIAIGLAVDDTIHFMHNFRRYYEQTGDPVKAVHQTLNTTGRALLVTSIVLSVGFFIFMFANMGNIFNFGLLTGTTIIFALLADYFVAPALMVLINRPGGTIKIREK